MFWILVSVCKVHIQFLLQRIFLGMFGIFNKIYGNLTVKSWRNKESCVLREWINVSILKIISASYTNITITIKEK